MSIQATFINLEDGTRRKKSGELVYEGQPLSLDVNGELKVAAATDKVYGLSKLDSNTYRDFAFGEYAAFGSGQLTVLVKGIALVSNSVYNQIEVTSETSPTSSPVTVKLFDDTVNYAVGEPLYMGATGMITNDGAAGKNSLFGKVLKTNLQTGGALEIQVDPGSTASKAEMAA